jgi:biotin transport system substrate-specific component
MVQASFILDRTGEQSKGLHNLMLILGASIIIGLFAPVSIRLPFSPVPIAFQGHVVLFLAALLGSKRGALAVLALLFQGAVGLPVFAGAKTGLLHLAGPTGGYLVGYVVAAFVTGLILENAKVRTAGRAMLALLAGNVAIYLFGLPWLAGFIGMNRAVLLGLLPFLAGDLLKIVFCLRGLKSLKYL